MTDKTASEPPRLTFIQRTRRAQLIECAIAVLAEDGYAQASLSRIAKRAEVTRGVISYHFADRDELLDAVVSEVYGIATEQLRPKIDAQPTALMAVRTFITGSAEFYRDFPTHMAALHEIASHARGEDGMLRHAEQSRANDQELSAVGVLLERGKQNGEFREFSTSVMARTIRSALDGLLVQMRADPDYDAIRDAEELADIFEHALSS
ncbi:TetR/AcrR family transcriptional regulator [Paramicrobacterium agarici]|uniref:TetR family transcriptional regulator n=1 Tax=Paramicrobacterium agarici TaxID=630514 RepID=A0A2A9DYH1_9MICO|nr:TetR family transcriptional regulator [Microbacterium agarici]PFG31857.1 TetR family transcriptional regulator [Microbacterium agarici]